MLLMHSSIKEVSFSWLAFPRRQPCYFWLVQVSAVYCYSIVMIWINNKKAYDMVPRSWILYRLKMYKIPNQVVQFIEKTMKTWKVELTAGGKSLTKVKVQGCIFQGDALPPLRFVIAMMPLNHILRKCTAGYKLS